jgi:hypothetical protein
MSPASPWKAACAAFLLALGCTACTGGASETHSLACFPAEPDRTLEEIVAQPLVPFQACFGRLDADTWAVSFGTRLAMVYLGRSATPLHPAP